MELRGGLLFWGCVAGLSLPGASAASPADPQAITINCGGATITLVQGDQPISLTCGAATLNVPARARAGGAVVSTPAPVKTTNATIASGATSSASTSVSASGDAPIVTLASAKGEAPPASNPPPPPAAAGNEAKDQKNTSPTGAALSAHDFYVGAGFSMAQNIGSKRADDVKFVTRASDGRLLAQVQTSEDRNISAMFETHYLLHNQGIFNVTKSVPDPDHPGQFKPSADLDPDHPWYANIDNLGRVLACGPFAFVSYGDLNRAGCGPLFAAIIDTDGKVSQFGLGWAIGLGKDQDSKESSATAASDGSARSNFGVGIGFLFSPGAKVLDTRIVDPTTLLVRPDFQAGVQAGSVSALVSRPTTSAFVMVSKTF
jgi:hypothetical protein